MTKLTSAQRDALTEQFCEIVVDNMSMESLICYAQEQMAEWHDNLMESELEEMIHAYDEELWDQLVDNVQSVQTVDTSPTGHTYGLEPGESLSFPVHSDT